jgi:hypothetical protein
MALAPEALLTTKGADAAALGIETRRGSDLYAVEVTTAQEISVGEGVESLLLGTIVGSSAFTHAIFSARSIRSL